MALLPIIIAPDPRLRVKTVPLARVDEETRVFMENMLETMYSANGIGLLPRRLATREVSLWWIVPVKGKSRHL